MLKHKMQAKQLTTQSPGASCSHKAINTVAFLNLNHPDLSDTKVQRATTHLLHGHQLPCVDADAGIHFPILSFSCQQHKQPLFQSQQTAVNAAYNNL